MSVQPFDRLLTAAREFAAACPDDRRLPPGTETAELFDAAMAWAAHVEMQAERHLTAERSAS